MNHFEVESQQYQQQQAFSNKFQKLSVAPEAYKQPILTFDNKMNRLVVPLYCGTCRAYGCQCYATTTDTQTDSNNSSAAANPIDLIAKNNSLIFPSTGSNSEATNSFTDNLSTHLVAELFSNRNFNAPAVTQAPNDYQSLFSNIQGTTNPIFYNQDRFSFAPLNSTKSSISDNSSGSSFTQLYSSSEPKFNQSHMPNLTDKDQTDTFLNRVFCQRNPGSFPAQSHIHKTNFLNQNPTPNEMKYKYQQQQQQQPIPYTNVQFLNSYFAQQQQLLQQAAGFTHVPTQAQPIKHHQQQQHQPKYTSLSEIEAFNNMAKANNMFYFNQCISQTSSNNNNQRLSYNASHDNNSNNIEQFIKQYQQFDSSQSFSSNSSNFDSRFSDVQFIKPKQKHIQLVPSTYQVRQQPVQLILNSYHVDSNRKPNKAKTLNTKSNNNSNNSNRSSPRQQTFVANTSNRNKKFAAYETILYNSNKSSDHDETSTSSSLSSSPTPLLDQFSSSLYDRYNISTVNVIKPNSAHRNTKYVRSIRPLQSQIPCRLGNNCRYKRENKCKYYHPIYISQRGNKYKNENIIDISDYSIDLNDTGLDMDDSFFIDKTLEGNNNSNSKLSTKISSQTKSAPETDTNANSNSKKQTDKTTDSMYSSDSSLASLKRLDLNSPPPMLIDKQHQQEQQNVA